MPNKETTSAQRDPSVGPGGLRSAWLSNRWLRFLVWALASLLLLGALVYVGVPPLVKWQLQKIASDKLGRAVTLGSVDFKPWSLELTLQDLAIAAADASAVSGTPAAPPQLAIRRIYVNAELESLLRLAPVADAITVEDPVARLTRLPDGRLDIDDVLTRLQPAPDTPPGQLPQFSLYNLNVTGGSLTFTDQAVKTGGRADGTSSASVHELKELTLGVPFLSNLPSERQITTEPRLAFTLDGSRFDTAAVGTPFAQTRKTDATLKIAAFDLQPWLVYLPDSLPVRVRRGVLDADLTIAFEQSPTAKVKLSGRLAVNKGQIDSVPGRAIAGKTASPGSELLAFEQLSVTLADVRPLERIVRLTSLELARPVLEVARNRSGQLNWASPAVSSVAPVVRAAEAASSAAASAPASSARKPAADAWSVELARAAVQGGTLRWRDESLAQAATLALSNVAIEATAVKWPFVAAQPVQFKGSAGLDLPPARVAAVKPVVTTAGAAAARPAGPRQRSGAKSKAAANARTRPDTVPAASDATGASTAAAAANATPAQPAPAAKPARLTFSGSATDRAAQVTATLAGWPLALAQPYAESFLQPVVSGVLDTDLTINWQAADSGRAPVLRIAAPKLAVADIALVQQQATLMSVRRIEAQDLQVDMQAHAVRARSLQLTQPLLSVERDAERRWMFERWLVGREVAADSDKAEKAEKAGNPGARAAVPEAPPWAVSITELAIDGGALGFTDRAVTPVVAFDISALNARLGALVLGGGQAAGSAKAAAPAAAASGQSAMPLSASLRIGAPRSAAAGPVEFKGTVGFEPAQAQGQLTARAVPVQVFEPYFGELLNVALLRADTGFTGQMAYRQTPAGLSLSMKGDGVIEQFRSNTRAPAEELLSWKSLRLGGLALSLEPGRATRVDVAKTALNDFFARIIVTPEGRINLQDLLRKPGQPNTPTAAEETVKAAAVAIKSGAARARAQREGGQNDAKSPPPDTTAAAAAAAPARAAASSPAAVVNFGPIELASGRVLFSDRFIKPNYSANLTELNGRLSAFSSAPLGAGVAPQLADLELRGRAEESASLEIIGKLNPLADPLVLDIIGKVRDLRLPPLSPYAIKYAGYGITSGRLSMDVNYVITPGGQLTASNSLTLNQLSFGEKVVGAPASLPVKLAVALLADRNGIIKLDIPIRGSLNDPQFSIGPLIVQALVNVVSRAITAPFSLLGKVFQGAGGRQGRSVDAVAGGAAGAGAGAGAEANEDAANQVAFEAGSAQLSTQAKAGLDQIAKALAERSALKLTVTGHASLQAERDALKRAQLDARVRAVKARTAGSTPGGASPSAAPAVTAAEYSVLLKEVYKRAELPGRPRNFIGLDKDIPAAEMEQLLLDSIEVDEAAVRELAGQRAAAVRDYLAAAGLPPDRLVLGAAKTQGGSAPQTPRAELDLATP
jgi:Domain of Unknown Function (DUF748)